MKQYLSISLLAIVLSVMPSLTFADSSVIGNGTFKVVDETSLDANALYPIEQAFPTFDGFHSTVESKDMITKATALNKSYLTSIRKYYPCSYTCTVYPSETKNNLRFTAGGFDWIVWLTQTVNTAEDKKVQTTVAKFPLNATNKQTSYAVWTIDRVWYLHKSQDGKFTLQAPQVHNPPAEESWEYLVMNPNIDRPIVYLRAESGRYSSRNYYIGDGEMIWATNRYSSVAREGRFARTGMVKYANQSEMVFTQEQLDRWNFIPKQ